MKGYYKYMLNYFRHNETLKDSPVIYHSHDDYTPDPVEAESAFVEEPDFIAADRLSCMEWLEVNT